ncbi:hypothetical protein SSTU70S_01454 [Stutzerimonas stutzeri]
MKKTGAALARFALEQLGVSHTFGIPGVHNTELYDELNASSSIQPVLVSARMRRGLHGRCVQPHRLEHRHAGDRAGRRRHPRRPAASARRGWMAFPC